MTRQVTWTCDCCGNTTYDSDEFNNVDIETSPISYSVLHDLHLCRECLHKFKDHVLNFMKYKKGIIDED